MSILIEDTASRLDWRVLRGDTFTLALRRKGEDGELVNTSGLEASLRVRVLNLKQRTPNARVILEGDTSGDEKKAEIQVGIQGETIASNLSIVLNTDITEKLPILPSDGSSVLVYELTVWDPSDVGGTTDTWLEGTIYVSDWGL